MVSMRTSLKNVLRFRRGLFVHFRFFLLDFDGASESQVLWVSSVDRSRAESSQYESFSSSSDSPRRFRGLSLWDPDSF